jgi:hypothetical protein
VDNFQEVLNKDIANDGFWLIIIIISASVILFLLISLIVFQFTKRITEPIKQLTLITSELTKATNTEAKQRVIDSRVKDSEMFAAIREEIDGPSKQNQVDDDLIEQQPFLPQNESRDRSSSVRKQKPHKMQENEIEELKKIFYEFFVKENDSNKSKDLN